MKRISIAVTLAALLLLSSCRENVIEVDSLEKELFLKESAEGIYRNGTALFRYNEQRHQRAANPGRLQFRIQTDGQDTCLNVIMEAIPRNAGLHITTSIDYRSPGELISNMSHLECSRIDGTKIWLWSRDNFTGIIIDTGKL